jgi:hypothetical protein
MSVVYSSINAWAAEDLRSVSCSLRMRYALEAEVNPIVVD